MKAVSTTETSVNFYETTRRNVQEKSSPQNFVHPLFLKLRDLEFCIFLIVT
jgi:hypothetical protein